MREFRGRVIPFPPGVKESRTYRRIFGIESMIWGVYLLARSGIRMVFLVGAERRRVRRGPGRRPASVHDRARRLVGLVGPAASSGARSGTSRGRKMAGGVRGSLRKRTIRPAICSPLSSCRKWPAPATISAGPAPGIRQGQVAPPPPARRSGRSRRRGRAPAFSHRVECRAHLEHCGADGWSISVGTSSGNASTPAFDSGVGTARCRRRRPPRRARVTHEMRMSWPGTRSAPTRRTKRGTEATGGRRAARRLCRC